MTELTFPYGASFECLDKLVFECGVLEELQEMFRRFLIKLSSKLDKGFDKFYFDMLLAATKAEARVSVALMYRDRVVKNSDFSHERVLMQRSYHRLCYDEGWSEQGMSVEEYAWFRPLVGSVWHPMVAVGMVSVQDLYDKYFLVLGDQKFVRVRDAWVESDKGVSIAAMSDSQRMIPVLTAAMYKVLIRTVSAAGSMRIDSFGLSDELVADWCWLLTVDWRSLAGACYLSWFPPCLRRKAYTQFKLYPSVGELRNALASVGKWTSTIAVVVQHDLGYHVASDGVYDGSILDHRALVGVNMKSVRSVADGDIFAEALVSRFIDKHRARNTGDAAESDQLESKVRELSVGVDRVNELSASMYTSVGKQLSPRSLAGGGAFISSYPVECEIDDDRTRDLLTRLAEGPYLSERYHVKMKDRWARFRRKPQLDDGQGIVYHAFMMHTATDTSDRWRPDTDWRVPGWTSYLYEAMPGERVYLSYLHTERVDIRMDCCGPGEIVTSTYKFSTRKSVLWFTQSIRFKLVASDYVLLRLSVPDSMPASVGVPMRRYLHLPGPVTAAKCLESLKRSESLPVVLENCEHDHVVGIMRYSSVKVMQSGRSRLRLLGLHSNAPVKLLLTTEPLHALHSLRLPGVNLYTRSDCITVLFDDGVSVFDVELDVSCTLNMAVLQIVDPDAFDKSLLEG